MFQSILIVRPGAVGDLILSLPALEFLSSQAERTEVWCAEQNLPLIQFTRYKQSIISSGLDRVGVMHCDDVLARLSRFEAIYSWYGAARADFRMAVGALPFHFYDALPPGHRQHATDFYCGQVGADILLPKIIVPPAAREAFFILHPFASNRAKQWPLDRFRALAGILGDMRWCAGPEDLARHPGAVENPVVIEDLFNLGKWIGTALAYIGNDSGITHLAAAVETPTIALFGPTDPAVWAPRGANVRVMARRSMDQIIPQEVAAAVYDLI
jgi:ADP-heptose:LPS heptosyltransferase